MPLRLPISSVINIEINVIWHLTSTFGIDCVRSGRSHSRSRIRCQPQNLSTALDQITSINHFHNWPKQTKNTNKIRNTVIKYPIKLSQVPKSKSQQSDQVATGGHWPPHAMKAVGAAAAAIGHKSARGLGKQWSRRL